MGDNRDVAECVYHVERFRRTREERLETPTSFNMGIFDRASGDVLGGIGYNRIQPETAQAEVGYWVRPDRQRQGLCTEAVSEMVTWGFAPQSECGWGFRRITILCAQKNLASRRVPEKLGIPLELRARHERWLEGEGWADTLGFGLCADEWDPKAGRVISGIRP
jgi:RimJ/RimL family protein N-acetyltransferase